jgi:hypothetical protein
MTIDEAIEIKTQWDRAGAFAGNPKLQQADRLSIEALKMEKQNRDHVDHYQFHLLPGETAE